MNRREVHSLRFKRHRGRGPAGVSQASGTEKSPQPPAPSLPGKDRTHHRAGSQVSEGPTCRALPCLGPARRKAAASRALAVFSRSTHLGVHALHLVLLQLELHEVVDDVEELGGDGFEVLVVVVLDRQRREDGVVDQRGPQVGQDARGVLPRVFVKVLGYEVVQNRISQELQALVTICGRPRAQVSARANPALPAQAPPGRPILDPLPTMRPGSVFRVYSSMTNQGTCHTY